jgi:uncharacterized cupredoxin-like copper-binding protein
VTAAPPPARVQVSAQEFRFILSRPTIEAGAAIVQLVNFGEDPHDLRLRRIGGTRTYRTRLLQPGEHADLVFRKLAAGRYELWCGVPSHRALGMAAVLIVKR